MDFYFGIYCENTFSYLTNLKEIDFSQNQLIKKYIQIYLMGLLN